MIRRAVARRVAGRVAWRSGGRHDEGDRGSVAAELAVALPAVLLTLMLGVGALGAGAQQVLLQDAVADAARMLGRGESEGEAFSLVTAAAGGGGGVRVSEEDRDGLTCVTARQDFAVGRVIAIPLSASSCALAGGL